MNKKRQNKKKDILILLVVVFIFTIIFFVFSQTNKDLNQIINKFPDKIQNQKNTNDKYILLTPTVSPSNVNGWKVFTFPDPKREYSFEFPESWSIISRKDKPAWENDVLVSLRYQEENSQYAIIFMQDGRGSPQYDYDETEIIQYGGRSATKHILYRDGKPFEIFVSFNDKKNDPFVGIDIQLPATMSQDNMVIIDKILSTLKFKY